MRVFSLPSTGSLFLDACRGLATPRPPLWMMRQAGRYLPEYREVRKKVSFLELCKTPGAGRRGDAAADPALRLRRRHPVLGPAGAAGGDGPGGGVHRRGPDPAPPGPHRRRPGPDRARSSPAQKTPYVLETIERVRAGLSPAETPLIGFAGAPFTVATYAIEGKTSKRFLETKKLLYQQPADRAPAAGPAGREHPRLPAGPGGGRRPGHPDLRFLAGGGLGRRVERVRARADRGAGGRRCAPAACRSSTSPTGRPPSWTGWRRSARTSTASTGGCRSTRPASGCSTAAPSTPRCRATWIRSLLMGPPDRIERTARDIIERGQRRGHVFNLGHGINPETPISGVETLVRTVKGA